jgi:EAL domain-containing protein (putative c-di-GMP-specific phosphodiesterase class I)
VRLAHPHCTTKPVPSGAGFFYEIGGSIGFAALVRWRHPERGLVVPGEFNPMAYETGRIIPLGQTAIIQVIYLP